MKVNINILDSIKLLFLNFVIVFILLSNIAIYAQEDATQAQKNNPKSEEELIKESQNPIASLISFPIQSDTNFGLGPNDRTQQIFQLQPVLPFALGSKVNLITRAIIPFLIQPDVSSNSGSTFGLGDINLSMFFSPNTPGNFVWGIGPIVQFKTATDDMTGTGKWGAGPSAVVVWMPGNWVTGFLVSNLWSFAGDDDRKDINLLSLQPFLNYNLPQGWFLTTSPVITANWEVDNDNRWTIPIGGGIGKGFRIGKVPATFFTRANWVAQKPSGGPNAQLQFQLKFLFPTGRK